MKKSTNQPKYFYYVLWLPVLLVGLLFLSGEVGVYLLRVFSSDAVTYISFDNSIFSDLFLFLVILDFVILDFYFIRVLGKNSDFNSKFIGSAINAKTITKCCIVVCSIIFLLATSFLVLRFNTRTQANAEGLKKCNIIEEDTIIFEYDEAEAVDVYLEWVNRGKHNNGYVTFIKVKAKSGVYTFPSDGFSDDYFYIEKFLSNFNADIITVDKTFSDKTDDIIGYIEQSEAFEKIYK